jgi:hypothetical protein
MEQMTGRSESNKIVHFPSSRAIIGDMIRIRIQDAYPHSLWGHPELIEKNRSVKIGRNDLCPCGSGIKYKNCCRNLKMEMNIKEEYKRKYDIRLKGQRD